MQHKIKGKIGKADLLIAHGSKPMAEYNNTNLFPGMYPTLFPYGFGGFDQSDQRIKVSFEKQVNYLFDIFGHKFRYHSSFMFVALNIIQRRKAHLHTHFIVKRRDFATISSKLISLTPEVLDRAADIVQDEGTLSKLSEKEQDALLLLKQVNTVTTHVPGSHAAKIRAKSEIMSYIGFKGVPQLFLTINPSPHHNPVFQVMYGDETVNLDERYPDLVDGPTRSIRVAQDPVAASDFFDLSVTCIFRDLFGWDFENGETSDRGGILGELDAFYGSCE
ncbi:hypothetical protein SCHPADRAFT_831849, partial [Schizopora paradoxa]